MLEVCTLGIALSGRLLVYVCRLDRGMQTLASLSPRIVPSWCRKLPGHWRTRSSSSPLSWLVCASEQDKYIYIFISPRWWWVYPHVLRHYGVLRSRPITLCLAVSYGLLHILRIKIVGENVPSDTFNAVLGHRVKPWGHEVTPSLNSSGL